MKRIYINIILFLSFVSFLNAQPSIDKKRDYQWIFGYKYDNISANLLDFNVSPALKIGIYGQHSEFLAYNSNICNTVGKLQFYTNGCAIVNNQHKIVSGSDSLNKGVYKDAFCQDEGGLKFANGAMFLPKPNSDSIYYLFHNTINQYGYCLELMLTTINANSKNGEGKVVSINQKLFSDTIDYKISATRHANGRDWWVLAFNNNFMNVKEDYYYKVLVTPDSIRVYKQSIDNISKRKRKYYSQLAFSPDGLTFARYRDGDGVYLYDFDRTSGILSNVRNVFINSFDWNGGVTFSPNSRFLYVLAEADIFQIDLWDSNLATAKQLVAKWDGVKTNNFPNSFGFAQLGPDCKIYVTPQGTTEYLTVINYPNRKKTACGVEQHAIKFPTKIAWALPNYPNFRLRKLGESFQPCDSTISPYIVANSEVIDKTNHVTFAVYPNPAQEHINVDLFGYVNRYERGTWDLYDMSGKLAVSFPLLQGHSEYVFDISSVPNGVYIWRVSFNGTPTSFAGKVIVMKE